MAGLGFKPWTLQLSGASTAEQLWPIYIVQIAHYSNTTVKEKGSCTS